MILKKHNFIFIIIDFLLISVSNAFGDTGDGKAGHKNILILISSENSVENTKLESLIAESLSLELERLGLQILLESDVPGIDASSSFDEILAEMVKQEIDLASVCTYSTEGAVIHFELSSIDPADPAVPVSVSKKGEVDITMDELFAEAVNEIVVQLKDRGSAPSIVSSEVGKPRENSDPPESATTTVIDEASRTAERPESEISESVEILEPRDRIYLGLGYAPFIAAGQVNYYFSLGSLITLYGDYMISTSFGDLGLGIFTGIQFFRAEGLIADSNNLLFPVGADIRYGTSTENMVRAFLHFTGGMAMFLFRPVDGDCLFKILGYVSGGVGSSIWIKKLIGITLDVSYFLYFEQLYPIMGFAPSINVGLRL